MRLQGIDTPTISRTLGRHKATVYRWLRGIERSGCLRDFLKKYASAKKRTRQIRIHPDATRLIGKRRKERPGLCGQKIRWWLQEEYGIQVSVATIRGVDMYDCVSPTRLARHGAIWQPDCAAVLHDDTMGEEIEIPIALWWRIERSLTEQEQEILKKVTAARREQLAAYLARNPEKEHCYHL